MILNRRAKAVLQVYWSSSRISNKKRMQAQTASPQKTSFMGSFALNYKKFLNKVLVFSKLWSYMTPPFH